MDAPSSSSHSSPEPLVDARPPFDQAKNILNTISAGHIGLHGASNTRNLPHPGSSTPTPAMTTLGGSISDPASAAGVGISAGSMQGMAQVADKSCLQCRSRKVKCDRRWPACTRCKKRQELCEFDEDVSLAIQISTSRPAKRAAVDIEPDIPRNASSISVPYQSIELVSTVRPAKHSDSTELNELWDKFMGANIGEQSVDWRLAKPAMASSLTLHLLEASQHSCCFHLPAFHTFAPRINYLKSHLHHLDIQNEVVVAILASLGARASPHSALIGVAGPDVNIEQVKLPREFIMTAGTKRENAWRALADRATSLCSRPEILQVPSKDNIEILVACIQMLMLSKVRPVKSRFFLRNVTGMFEDIQRLDVPLSEILSIKRSVARTLYECDARVAAYSSSPLFISDLDIGELFDGTGIVLPDLSRDNLAGALDTVFQGPLCSQQVEDALALAGYWVCALQRRYAKIASARRPSMDLLGTIPELWKWIDSAHTAIQALHRRFVNLQRSGVHVPGSDHDIEFDLLIAVRMDNRLIDLVNLAHEFLRRQFDRRLESGDVRALSDLFALSDQRVRKCLKLSAFYSKVYIDSRDKHVIYHLVVQLEALPQWATMAPQRAGEATTAGPLTSECELTDQELDWLTDALELACYFTPLAAERLEELSAGRAARGDRSLLRIDQTGYSPTIGRRIDYDYGVSPPQNEPPSGATPPYHRADRYLGSSLEHSIMPLPPPSSQYTFDSYGTPYGSKGHGVPLSYHTGTDQSLGQDGWYEYDGSSTNVGQSATSLGGDLYVDAAEGSYISQNGASYPGSSAQWVGQKDDLPLPPLDPPAVAWYGSAQRPPGS